VFLKMIFDLVVHVPKILEWTKTVALYV